MTVFCRYYSIFRAFCQFGRTQNALRRRGTKIFPGMNARAQLEIRRRCANTRGTTPRPPSNRRSQKYCHTIKENNHTLLTISAIYAIILSYNVSEAEHMKAITGWNFRPYSPMPKEERARAPYICRLAPRAGGFTVEFIDNGASNALHTIYWRRRGAAAWRTAQPTNDGGICAASIDCGDQTDYEVYAARQDGSARSEIHRICARNRHQLPAPGRPGV